MHKREICQSNVIAFTFKRSRKRSWMHVASFGEIVLHKSNTFSYTTPKIHATHQRQGMMTMQATWHPRWL